MKPTQVMTGQPLSQLPRTPSRGTEAEPGGLAKNLLHGLQQRANLTALSKLLQLAGIIRNTYAVLWAVFHSADGEKLLDYGLRQAA